MNTLVFDTNDIINVRKTGTSQYQLYLNNEIPCTKVLVKNVIIPYTFYQINENNDLISIDNISYYLTHGTYNALDLLNLNFIPILVKHSTNNTQTPLLNNNFYFQYDKNNLKYNFTLTPSTFASFNIKFTTSYSLFGAEMNVNYTISSTQIFMPNIANMNSINDLYIRSNISNNFIYSNYTTSILSRVPITTSSGNLIIYENTNKALTISTYNKTLNNITITLTDNNARQINMNGANFTIEFILIE